MPLHITELLEDQLLLILPAHVAVVAELDVELAELVAIDAATLPQTSTAPSSLGCCHRGRSAGRVGRWPPS
eukprot:8828277-Heterocapsa_arctica.AAC.1